MEDFNYRENQRYIIPTYDWGFKRLFGTEMNKDILIGLLNRLLPEENILDVTYLNTEVILPVGRNRNARKLFDIRKGVVDVYCKCQDDRRIIVEMQNWAKPAFVDRAIVYAAAAILENYTITRSRRYDVKKTYFIAITGTSVFPDMGHAPVKIGLCDLDAVKTVQLSKKVLLMFVELPKFAECTEQLDSDSSFLDEFSVTMKTMGRSEEKPETLKDDLIERMYLAADTLHYDKKDTDQYNSSIMTELEYQATLEDYFNDGMEKGMEKGKAEGLAEGMEKGMAEEKRAMARTLLSMGVLTIAQISKATGLSAGEIKALR